MNSIDPHKPSEELVVKGLDALLEEIEDVAKKVDASVFGLRQKNNGHYNLANEVGWHMRGLVYHYRNLFENYQKVCHQIAERATIDAKPSVLIFHSPEMQALLFEFYSITVLSRITLDHIVQHTMSPLFSSNLPGSANTFLKGTSDYDLHEILNEEPEVRYLFDTRDCMVHFRTFAVADNTVAISDSVDEKSLPDIGEYLKYPIARTYFRLTNNNKLSVNILLPDHIYKYGSDGSRDGLVKKFTYTERHNILRKSMSFITICAASTIHTLDRLSDGGKDMYTWRKSS